MFDNIQISFYRASAKDLPEPLPTLYSRFLTIYGRSFDAISPEFTFDPHMFQNREAMLSFFPFLIGMDLKQSYFLWFEVISVYFNILLTNAAEPTQSEPVSSEKEEDIWETMLLAVWEHLGEDDIRKYVNANEDWEALFSGENKEEAKFELAEKQATMKEMSEKAAAKKAAKKKEGTKREETEKKTLGNNETKWS